MLSTNFDCSFKYRICYSRLLMYACKIYLFEVSIDMSNDSIGLIVDVLSFTAFLGLFAKNIQLTRKNRVPPIRKPTCSCFRSKTLLLTCTEQPSSHHATHDAKSLSPYCSQRHRHCPLLFSRKKWSKAFDDVDVIFAGVCNYIWYLYTYKIKPNDSLFIGWKTCMGQLRWHDGYRIEFEGNIFILLMTLDFLIIAIPWPGGNIESVWRNPYNWCKNTNN